MALHPRLDPVAPKGEHRLTTSPKEEQQRALAQDQRARARATHHSAHLATAPNPSATPTTGSRSHPCGRETLGSARTKGPHAGATSAGAGSTTAPMAVAWTGQAGGPSPRARGALGHGDRVRLGAGTIPAGAGSKPIIRRRPGLRAGRGAARGTFAAPRPPLPAVSRPAPWCLKPVMSCPRKTGRRREIKKVSRSDATLPTGVHAGSPRRTAVTAAQVRR